MRKFDIRPYTRAAVIGTILIFILVSGLSINVQMRQSVPLLGYDSVFSVIETLVRAMYVVLAAVIISRLVIDEFRNKTITVMFTYPINRQMVMVAKLSVVIVFTLIGNIASCLLVAAAFATLNHVEGVIPGLLTWSVAERFFIVVLTNALATSFLSLIPLYFGMRKHSVATTITSSVLVAALVCQNIGGVTLYSIIAVPISLAILGAVIGYLSIRNIEHVDVLKS
ncbi:ABC transporter permease [Alicyclobacillus sp. ALC3]|nr:ABC transporter permease [Alicyclobacillus sp. ALC3]